MFLWFPVYQITATIGVLAIVFSAEAIASTFYALPLTGMLAIVIGVPILASWHLSVLLFGCGFFDVLARLGLPFTARVTRELEKAIDWFRPAP